MKMKRAARAARALEQLGDVLCKTLTWNYHICCFDDNLSLQPKIFNTVFNLAAGIPG